MLDLEPAVDELAAIVTNIGEEQLALPTPCERLDVADLLTHVHGLVVAFRDAAFKISGPTTSEPPAVDGAELPMDWRYSIRARLTELVAAWRMPEAWQGETEAGGIRMTGEECGVVLNSELVLHGWDLAVATRQPFAVAADNLQAAWEFVERTPDSPDARQGLYGPRLWVAPDAPLLDRTLAYAGRNSLWDPYAG